MTKFILPAAFATVVTFGFAPSHAQASWFSEALRGGGYNRSYYGASYYGGPVVVVPGGPGYYNRGYQPYYRSYRSSPCYHRSWDSHRGYRGHRDGHYRSHAHDGRRYR